VTQARQNVACLVFAAVLGIAVTARSQPGAPTHGTDADELGACSRLLSDYIAAVRLGDLAQAASCWRRADVVSADRLGIRYRQMPLKVDGDSPLWLHARALRDGRAACRAGTPVAVPGPAPRVTQALVLGSDADTVRFTYHFAREDGRWRLTSPVALAQAGRDVATATQIRLVDVRAAAVSGEVLDRLVVSLDSCVADIAARLSLDDAVRGRLVAGKLGYLLADPDEVARLASAPTVVVANLQQDVVITSHPCHAHELAHLVVNAWLSDLPPFMLPLLQEGTAVQLGGRWGRHPRVMERLGRTTLSDGWVALDDLLTRDGFLAQPADLTYAPAGVFVGFILEQYGAAGLRAACLAAGGDAESLSRLDADAVQARLAGALGTDWAKMAAAFAAYAARPVSSGIAPGWTMKDDAAATRLAAGDLRVTIDDADLTAPVGISVQAADGGSPQGAILFGGGPVDAPVNALFSEHFPGRTYRGETHALIFTRDEAKLYDYRLQMLVALHAEGFWPSDSYVVQDGAGLRLRVDRSLWPAEAIMVLVSHGEE
jgi:hypothetical protein